LEWRGVRDRGRNGGGGMGKGGAMTARHNKEVKGKWV